MKRKFLLFILLFIVAFFGCAPKYNVYFEENGGSLVEDLIVKENEIIELPIITKEGYDFLGWYKNSDFSSEWNEDEDIVIDNITLYAKWEPKEYRVVFENCDLDEQKIKYNSYITEPIIQEETGYHLEGWYIDSNYITLWDFENDKVTSNMSLYPKFEINKYNVSFYDAELNDVLVSYNNKVEKPTDPKREGLSFKGWYTDLSYETLWDFKNNKIIKDTIIYAKWETTLDCATDWLNNLLKDYKEIESTIPLPSSYYNCSIRWKDNSKLLQIYFDEGHVHKRIAEDTKIKLSATLKIEDEIKEIEYEFIVKKSPPAKPNFYAPEGGYDGSEVTLKFYHALDSSSNQVLEKYIKKFNEIYPNVHINHVQLDEYDSVRYLVVKEINEENRANIALCLSEHIPLFNLSGSVVTLDDLIASTASDNNNGVLGLTDEEINDFIEIYYEEGKQFGDDLMYSMPFSQTTEVLYYNKTFFEENNLKVPTTWLEMEEVCRKIKAIDPNCIPLGYDTNANLFINMCEQLGSPYTSYDSENRLLFNNDTNKGFVKMLGNWYKEGLITTEELYGINVKNLFKSPYEVKSYMVLGLSYDAKEYVPNKVNDAYPFEVGIASIPQVNTSNPKVISQGPSICIFKSKNLQEVVASWLFVKFLVTNTNFQTELSIASGFMPVLKSVKENEVFKDYLKKADDIDYVLALSTKVCIEQEDAYFTTPGFIGSSVVSIEVNKLLNNVFKIYEKGNASDKELDESFKKAIDECQYAVN